MLYKINNNKYKYIYTIYNDSIKIKIQGNKII